MTYCTWATKISPYSKTHFTDSNQPDNFLYPSIHPHTCYAEKNIAWKKFNSNLDSKWVIVDWLTVRLHKYLMQRYIIDWNFFNSQEGSNTTACSNFAVRCLKSKPNTLLSFMNMSICVSFLYYHFSNFLISKVCHLLLSINILSN